MISTGKDETSSRSGSRYFDRGKGSFVSCFEESNFLSTRDKRGELFGDFHLENSGKRMRRSLSCLSLQAERVARRFGMAAAAGELATEAGLTGWPKGHATECVAKCFQNWLLNFGATGNREDRKLLAQVRAFFETHGASRFQEIGTRHGVAEAFDVKVINRAGFVRRVEGGGREFIVLPEAFKRDVCAGFDAKRASKSLIEAGWLRPGSNGKASRTERLPHMGDKVRCYVFTQAMWKDSGDDI